MGLHKRSRTKSQAEKQEEMINAIRHYHAWRWERIHIKALEDYRHNASLPLRAKELRNV